MKFKKSFAVVITLGLTCGNYTLAGSAELSVDEIVSRANHAALYQGQDSKGRVSLTISDKSGRVRKRAFNILRKDVEGSEGDQMYYTLFRRPADVRNLVFMVQKHASLETDDDRWLYLPGLDLVKRIAASDKRTSFAGSNFLYEDISGRSPMEDEHLLIKETESNYVIQNKPKLPDSVEFSYYLSHIDKNSFLPVKVEFFNHHDRCYRVIEALEIEFIQAIENGKPVVYPTVVKSIARDLEAQTSSEMVFSNIQYNLGLSKSLFTERYLRRAPKDAMH